MDKIKEKIEVTRINFAKLNGLVPVCIQDHYTLQMLMLGFMNQQALDQTLQTQLVTFWSRTKERLWVKGETSGNYLTLVDLFVDCDGDTLLMTVIPHGPVCHTGSQSCFQQNSTPSIYWLNQLIALIEQRYQVSVPNSYTNQLFIAGTSRIAQKVGEEGVEVALAALGEDKTALKNEVADLLFHLLVLLTEQRIALTDIITILQQRMKK